MSNRPAGCGFVFLQSATVVYALCLKKYAPWCL